MNENITKKEEKEIKIKNILSEIDNKKDFLKSFKKRYLNKIKTDNITLKINNLNKLINEFEKTISLVLEILLSYQEELQSNNKIPIKLKNIKENNRNVSNENYNYSLNNKKDNSYFKNDSIIPKNSKRIIIKNHSIEANKDNSSNNKININCNNNDKNNNSCSLKNISFNKTYNKQNVDMPYYLFLKNQLSHLANNNNSNIGLFHNFYGKKFPSLKEKTLQTLYNTEYINYNKNKKETFNSNNYNTNNEIIKENNNINSLELDNRSNSENNLNSVKAKTPIRKSLRALIKEKNVSNKSCHQMKNKFNDKNNNIYDDEELIKKINESEKYKLYFSDKYGEGNYFNFINKYKKNLLNKKLIQNELNLISRVIELNEKKENNNYYKKDSLNNLINGSENYNKSKTPIGIRKRILIQKNKNNNKINTKDIKKKKNVIFNKDIKRLNEYRIPKSNRYTNNIEELIKNFNK